MNSVKMNYYCVKILNIIKNLPVVDALTILKTIELSIMKTLKKDGDKNE